MNKRKFLVYKITNRFNNKIYIGVHSTLNENDRYMGSGIEIKEALKKEGRRSFVKEILFIFDTKEEMFAKEKELVTKEFCHRTDTYNRIEGGGTYLTTDMISVVDKDGNTNKVYNNDPRWLSGELIHVTKGTVTVKDLGGNKFRVKYDDERFKTGEIEMISKGLIRVRDKNNNSFSVFSYDPRYLNGELIPTTKGQKVNQKWLGKEHSNDSKQKMSDTASKRIGVLNNSFGTCWITKEGINKKIKKENLDEWIIQGWLKGRKIFQQRKNVDN